MMRCDVIQTRGHDPSRHMSRVTCHVSHGTHQTQSATGRGMEVSRASVINCGCGYKSTRYCLQMIMTEEEGTDYDKMTEGF